MRFDIQPYVGAIPISFGMTRAEVHRLLGPPETSQPVWDGSGVSEHYNRSRYNVGYTNAGVVDHVGFSPTGAELSLQGRPLWTAKGQPDPNPRLLALDPAPVEVVGFWFFLAVGVTTIGYHDDDPAQLAVCVFPRGKNADLLAQATPADTTRYRKRRG